MMDRMDPDRYFESLYTQTIKSQKLQEVSGEQKEWLKSMLYKSLGHFPEYQTTPRQVQVERKELEEYTREKVYLSFSEDIVIPLYILTPKGNQIDAPAVLALHGHGYGNKGLVGLLPDGSEDLDAAHNKQHFALKLVKRGIKVFVPEVIGFGERMLAKDKEQGQENSCYALSTLLLMAGKSLAGLRVAEAIALLDYMENYHDVQGNKIGIMGFSGGALVAAYTAALVEKVNATVLSGFTNTFKGSILAMHHCIDNYVPGILKYAELPDLISLISPRPLFIESGLNDPIFPIETAKEALAEISRVYDKEGASESLSYDFFDGGHEVSGRKAYDWLTRTLEV